MGGFQVTPEQVNNAGTACLTAEAGIAAQLAALRSSS
jgi:hypothetical protein